MTISAKRAAPEVLRFDARVDNVAGKKAGALSVFFAIPAPIAERLGSLENAEGSINGHPFRARIETDPTGRRVVRVNQAMLRGAHAAVGSTVSLAILGPEPALELAPDLRSALKASPKASATWALLPDLARRDYARWVDATNNAETRARRVQRTVEQLAEGKRRPCCVNFYEYSMSRIDPNWLDAKLRSRSGS